MPSLNWRTAWASYIVLIGLSAGTVVTQTSCTSPGKRTAIGAGAGAATGAAVGGATGGWKGAAVGAAAGGAVGGAVGGALGNVLDRQAKELAEVAETRRIQNGILVNLKNELLFETERAELKENARQQLIELGRILAKYPQDRIQIRGFTDNRGAVSFNQELSRRRAETVRIVLLEQGVKPVQMVAHGLGESEPVASNSTSHGRSKNRRVELLIDIPQQRQAG